MNNPITKKAFLDFLIGRSQKTKYENKGLRNMLNMRLNRAITAGKINVVDGKLNFHQAYASIIKFAEAEGFGIMPEYPPAAAEFALFGFEVEGCAILPPATLEECHAQIATLSREIRDLHRDVRQLTEENTRLKEIADQYKKIQKANQKNANRKRKGL